MKQITPEVIAELRQVGWFKELHLSMLAKADFRCEYCGEDFLARFNECFHAQLDHITPKSKGGSDDPYNLAAACVTCNALKWDYTPTGKTREERIADAARYIRAQREAEEEKLSRYREIMRGF
jgi:5-methylcytosine-specific restriction endonuclease McrA